jgi:tetratricopeptide (TPR) repeat protein
MALELGDKPKLSVTLNALAELYRQGGYLDEAEALYKDALALRREVAYPYGIALCLLNLAMLSIGRGVVDRVPAMLLEALAIANETGWKRIGWMTLEVCAGLATVGNECARAARLLGAAEAQMKQMGFRRVPPDEAFLAPLIAKAREALGESTFAAAESAGRSLSYEAATSEAREWLEGHAN